MAYIATRTIQFRGTTYRKGDRVPAETSTNRHTLLAVGRLKRVADETAPEPEPQEPKEPERTPDLTWTRAELNEHAATLGIDKPDELANKGDVLTAIEEAMTAPKRAPDQDHGDKAGEE